MMRSLRPSRWFFLGWGCGQRPPWLLISLVFGVEWYDKWWQNEEFKFKFHKKVYGGKKFFLTPPPLENLTLRPYMFRYEDWKEQRAESEEAARIKKNPDEYRSKMEGMEAARSRMQAGLPTDQLIGHSTVFLADFSPCGPEDWEIRPKIGIR